MKTAPSHRATKTALSLTWVFLSSFGATVLFSEELALAGVRPNGSHAAPSRPDWTNIAGATNPNLVFLRDASGRNEMEVSRPTLRAFNRPLTGVHYVLSLSSEGANFRTRSGAPEFEVILPRNVKPVEVLALVMFGESRNGERKVQIGDTKHPFPEQVIAARTIPLDARIASKQGAAPSGFIIHRIKPATLLDRGEYALILAKNDQAVYGPNEEFNVYDFAVE